MVTNAPLARGREALIHHDWSQAAAALSEADRQETLAAEDLDLLAEALWWEGRPGEAVQVWERAFTVFMESGRPEPAAMIAMHLGELAYRRGAISVANGWLARSERLVADLRDSPVHGWIKVERAVVTMIMTGDTGAGAELGEAALQIARRTGDQELEAMSLSVKGTALVRQGRWAEGMALIDEAAVAAGSGELKPRTACDVYCITISTCCEATDYRRAREWTEHVDRWMERQAIHGYRGECKVHRAELKRRRGDWHAAEAEALDACRELEDYHLLDAAANAYYEIGEVRLRMGDLTAAETYFRKAHELGRDPQPGLALSMLMRGEKEKAVRAVDRALHRSKEFDDRIHAFDDLLARAMILPAAVEIHLASGNTDQAVAYATELEQVAASYDSEALLAASRHAWGLAQLARGEIAEAIESLRQARRAWLRVDFPYDAARTRTLLAKAYLEAGEESEARLELQAARSVFAELGASADLREVARLLGDEDDGQAVRVRRTFMFTDIVTSTDVASALGDDAWNRLLRWHDRTLREAFETHHGEEVKHTGDGFFVSFQSAADAIGCAVAIQRLLDQQRREHGFALQVRIGLHTTDATEVDADYTGHGVHVAARVGAVAVGDEILVSADTYGAIDPGSVTVGSPRPVDLKGIKAPLEVRTIDWR